MREGMKAFLREKDDPKAQAVKYLACGGVSFVVDVVVFYAMAWLVLPSLRAGDPFGELIGRLGLSLRPVNEEVLLRHYYINKVIAFLCSNAAAYLGNVWFVFRGGRHNRVKEVGLFYFFSVVSFVVFTWLSGILIERFGWQVSGAYFFVFALAMVFNFSVRKHFVFKG